jgi:hypothetical protein
LYDPYDDGVLEVVEVPTVAETPEAVESPEDAPSPATVEPT